MLVSRPIPRCPRRTIAGVIIKTIESKVVDRGFGLQTDCAVRDFSYGEADEVEFRVGIAEKD